ncbi:MAG: DUF1833 family protein [Rhodospirillales bacterium]|nr:DUF1833 family protein [Rhodospirillales bacterium]
MPDPSLSAALAEAYASAPADVIVLHTLEIWHPCFVENGAPKPIRVVRNYEDTATWLNLRGAEVQAVLDQLDEKARRKVGLVARIEAGAARDAGLLVPFVALGFELELPPVDTIPVPEIVVTLDNVGREITKHLDAAAVSQDAIEVTYRPYLSTDINGPQMDPPLVMTLSEVEVDVFRVTGRARVLDIGNKAFPSQIYTIKKYPGLRR